MAKDEKKPEAKPSTTPTVSEAERENAKLRAIIARVAPAEAVKLDQMLEEVGGDVFINAKGQAIPEKYKGTISYRLSQPHYRQGIYLEPGSIVTVTDEIPGRTWTPVSPGAAASKVAAALEAGFEGPTNPVAVVRQSDKLV